MPISPAICFFSRLCTTSLSRDPGGKERVLEPPPHQFLALFTMQNLSLLEQPQSLAHRTDGKLVALYGRMRGKLHAVFVDHRAKEPLLYVRQTVPKCHVKGAVARHEKVERPLDD